MTHQYKSYEMKVYKGTDYKHVARFATKAELVRSMLSFLSLGEFSIIDVCPSDLEAQPKLTDEDLKIVESIQNDR